MGQMIAYPVKRGMIALKTAYALLPCAIAFWSSEPSSSLFNGEAQRLTGLSLEELPEVLSLWISCIHPEDRALFSATRDSLWREGGKVSCDYRFFPRGSKGAIWLRDTSIFFRNHEDKTEGILSVYTDISDLHKYHTLGGEGDGAMSLEKIVGGSLHEIQNSLQVISMGLDLTLIRMTQSDPLEQQAISRGINRISRLLHEVKEYLSPPEIGFSVENLTAVLEDVMQQVATEWPQRQGYLRIVGRRPLPSLRLDWQQFRRTFARVLAFAYALLPQSGRVEVEAGLQENAEQWNIELRVICTGTASLEVQEQEVFRPFLRVNGYPAGLSLVLARRMLSRHHGQITFHTENAQRRVFSIVLRAS